MARKLRLQYEGAIYHLTVRGNGRRRIFLDERDHRLKKCRGVLLLEGALCQGTAKFGRCDRSCFYFWREEWLEKMD